jgi:hypothetical protein
MRKTVLTAGIVVFTAASGFGFNLDSLLVQSVGGPSALEKLRTVTTISASGRLNLAGMPGTFQIYVATPDRICMQMNLGLFELTQAYDGVTAWQKDHNGMISELSGFEKRSLLSQVYFQTYSFLFPDRLPGKYEYLGLEERQGRSCHKVGFYPMLTDTVFSHFDVSSGYQSFDLLHMDNLEVATEYSNHRIYDGVLVAFTSHSEAPAAQVTIDLAVDTLVFNASFDESIFQRPLSENDCRFPADTDSVQVPFRLVGGHIYVLGHINGRRLMFILDSGASANIFHRPALDGLSITTVGKLPAAGVAGYEMVDLIRTDSLGIGGLLLLNQVGGALDLDLLQGNQPDSTPFGGVLGYDFLSRFPLLIDYQKELLTVYRPDAFQQPDGGHELSFDYTFQVPTISATLVGFPGRYLIDLGNPFELIVHREFSRRNDFLNRLDSVRDMGAPIGGIGCGLTGKRAVAATLALGDIEIAQLPVMLPDSSSGLAGSVELAGNIGNALLSRFRVLLDYHTRRLVLYDLTSSAEH